MKNRTRIYIVSIFLFIFIGLNLISADIPVGMVLIPGANGIDSFYMDKHEVTNSEFKKFVDANPLWQKDKALKTIVGDTYLWGWKGNMYPKGRADHPVCRISWFAAKAYAEWKGKNLPTETQWEIAARGKLVEKKFPWGNTSPWKKANYGRYTPKVSFKIPPTKKVGSYPPNQYGLYDMTGNVEEWCLDRLDVNDIHGRYHRMRGGSWFNEAEELYISISSQHPADAVMGTLGFRCVLGKNEQQSDNLVTDMSSWLYENMQNLFDSALYSVSEGFTPQSGLETKFDKIVSDFTGHSRTFESELIRVFSEVKVKHTSGISPEDHNLNQDIILHLWRFYLEIHFEEYEKSVDEKLALFKSRVIDRFETILMETGG